MRELTAAQYREYERVFEAANELAAATNDQALLCDVILNVLINILVSRFGVEGAIEALSKATNDYMLKLQGKKPV